MAPNNDFPGGPHRHGVSPARELPSAQSYLRDLIDLIDSKSWAREQVLSLAERARDTADITDEERENELGQCIAELFTKAVPLLQHLQTPQELVSRLVYRYFDRIDRAELGRHYLNCLPGQQGGDR